MSSNLVGDDYADWWNIKIADDWMNIGLNEKDFKIYWK